MATLSHAQLVDLLGTRWDATSAAAVAETLLAEAGVAEAAQYGPEQLEKVVARLARRKDHVEYVLAQLRARLDPARPELPKPVEVTKPVEVPKPAPVVDVKPVDVPKPVEVQKPVDVPKPVEVQKPVEAPKPAPVVDVKPVEAPKPAETSTPPETPPAGDATKADEADAKPKKGSKKAAKSAT